MTVRSKCGDLVRTLAGQQPAGARSPIAWDKLNDAGQPVPPGHLLADAERGQRRDAAYPWSGTARVLSTDTSPADPCGRPSSSPLTGAGYGHGVGLSQWGAYGMAKAGYDATGIVTHYYSGTTVTPVQDDMEARVNLLYQVASAKVRTEALEAGGGAIEVTVGADRHRRRSGRRVPIRGERARPSACSGSAGGQVTDLGSAPSVSIRWAGTRNSGRRGRRPDPARRRRPGSLAGLVRPPVPLRIVDIAPVSTSKGLRLNVVNSVRIHEEYLYGISEVSSSWPSAALQAQVLAARSYALSKVARGVRQACNCHMDDGGGPYYDQTFTGWTKASSAKGDQWVGGGQRARWRPTRPGLAILSEGKPISAFYSASSGGATQSVQDVWGGTLLVRRQRARPVDADRGQPATGRGRSTVPQSQMAKVFGVGLREHRRDHRALRVGRRQDGHGDGGRRQRVTRTGGQFQSALGLKSTFVTAHRRQWRRGAARARRLPPHPHRPRRRRATSSSARSRC